MNNLDPQKGLTNTSKPIVIDCWFRRPSNFIRQWKIVSLHTMQKCKSKLWTIKKKSLVTRKTRIYALQRSKKSDLTWFAQDHLQVHDLPSLDAKLHPRKLTWQWKTNHLSRCISHKKIRWFSSWLAMWSFSGVVTKPKTSTKLYPFQTCLHFHGDQILFFPQHPSFCLVVQLHLILNLHPWSLTWNLKISPWKRRFILETIIFRFHVKLGEGISNFKAANLF